MGIDNRPRDRTPRRACPRRAATFPDRDAIEALRALGLRYLLVYDGGRWPAWAEVEPVLRTYLDVRQVAREDAFAVLELVPP